MRIIIFWDSISEGFWDYEKGGWVNRLKIDYWKEYWYDRIVMNYGISSYTSKDLVNCFDNFFNAVSRRELWKEKQSIVIFAIGINDSSEVIATWEKRVDIQDFENNIKILIRKCQREMLIENVVFLGNINVDEKVINDETNTGSKHFFYNAEIQKYNNVIKKIAKDTTCPYIDLFWIMKTEDLEDGLHPNNQGHWKIYKVVKKHLK